MLQLLVAVCQQLVNDISIRLYRACLKSSEEVLYRAKATAVVLVIVIEEVGDSFCFIDQTPYILLEVVSQLRTVPFQLDSYSCPGLIDMENGLDPEQLLLYDFQYGQEQSVSGLQPVTVSILADLELVNLVTDAFTVYWDVQLDVVTC